jgi:hypothetical protein
MIMAMARRAIDRPSDPSHSVQGRLGQAWVKKADWSSVEAEIGPWRPGPGTGFPPGNSTVVHDIGKLLRDNPD